MYRSSLLYIHCDKECRNSKLPRFHTLLGSIKRKTKLKIYYKCVMKVYKINKYRCTVSTIIIFTNIYSLNIYI